MAMLINWVPLLRHSHSINSQNHSSIHTREKREMEVVQVLHMNGGKGETSYANNSLVQVKLITKPLPRIFSNHIGTYIQVVHDIPT